MNVINLGESAAASAEMQEAMRIQQHLDDLCGRLTAAFGEAVAHHMTPGVCVMMSFGSQLANDLEAASQQSPITAQLVNMAQMQAISQMMLSHIFMARGVLDMCDIPDDMRREHALLIMECSVHPNLWEVLAEDMPPEWMEGSFLMGDLRHLLRGYMAPTPASTAAH